MALNAPFWAYAVHAGPREVGSGPDHSQSFVRREVFTRLLKTSSAPMPACRHQQHYVCVQNPVKLAAPQVTFRLIVSNCYSDHGMPAEVGQPGPAALRAPMAVP